jgi:transposase-like protein
MAIAREALDQLPIGAELTEHSGHKRHERGERGADNRRNGEYEPKIVETSLADSPKRKAWKSKRTSP